MAESNSVRLLQHHLRQAGTLLAARELDSAATHLAAALEIDPMSPAALTLRDRLETLRAQTSLGTAARTVEPAPATPRFVPSGVNAASWLDFEQRIQDRRFRALIETAERAVAAGDGDAARSAVEEARELRPDGGDIVRLTARIALLQMPAAAKARESVLLSRTFRAASLLLVGVTLLMGLDWVRSGSSGRGSVPGAATAAPAVESNADALTVPTPPESIAAAETLGTSGIEAERPSLPSEGLPISVASAPVLTEPRSSPERQAPVASTETPDDFFVPLPTPFPRLPVSNPQVIRGEVPDDYVAPRRDPARDAASVNATSRGATAPTTLASVVRLPAPLAEPLVSSSSQPVPATVAAPAAVPPSAAAVIAPSINTVAEESRVRSVINQYANAYGQLNAAGVRSVWPSVDERALAKAFSDLSAQSVAFDSCEISIIGVVAHASCRGPASYVRKYGSQEPRKETHTVRFDLKREGDMWKIQKAETRK